MPSSEFRFALLISASHGIQHFLRRIFPPLIPIWVVVFEFPLALVGLLLGAQTLGSAAGQAPFGVLADRYDRRYILPTGIAVAAVCVGAFSVIPALGLAGGDVVVGGYSTDIQYVVMVVAMLGIGLGGSVLHPTGYPLITENVSPDRKGRVFGMWGSAAKLGDGLAPAVVGVLLLVIAWTEILVVISVAVCTYAVLLFVILGRFETRPRAAQEEADPSPAPAAETTDDGGELDVWRVDRRVYVYPMLAVFAFFAIRMLAAGGVNVFIPEFITSEYSYSFVVGDVAITPTSTASFYYSALLITAGIVQLGTGRLVDAYDPRLVVIGFLLVATGVLFILAFGDLSAILLFVVLLGLGASLWALEPARDAIVSDITPPDREGRTFGYLWTGALIVGAFSPVMIGYIGDIAGLRPAFGVLAVATLLSAVPIALLLSDRVYVDLAHTRRREGVADDD